MLASWNVEGLGAEYYKLEQIIFLMAQRNISILCMQETQCKGLHHFMQNGFLIILSGVAEESCGRANAGVGFIVAPWAIGSIIGFTLFSDRLSMLRVRVSGGNLNLITAYAPHSGHKLALRQSFFHHMQQIWRPLSAHTATIAMGDWNAKLYRRFCGEEDIIGKYVFESPVPKHVSITNRELLVEACVAIGACVANTHFLKPSEQLVTYHNLTTKPMHQISPCGFAQIDHCLVDRGALHLLDDISTDRRAPLPTHHFILLATLAIKSEKDKKTERNKTFDASQLVDKDVSRAFCTNFREKVLQETQMQSLNDRASGIEVAMHAAAADTLYAGSQKKRPWISSTTLALIQQRELVRAMGDRDGELLLNRQIRKAAKQNRREWLESMLAGGSWSAVRRLRRKPAVKPTQIKNERGELVDSHARSNTMADYFENVQWKVSLAELVPEMQYNLGDDLPVKCENFDIEELRAALRCLAAGKASGIDDIPPDFWKVMLQNDGALVILLDLCRTCWDQKDIPEDWRIATVVLLFKKGDAALPSNYRPISLLPVGYKVLAWMLQKRLQAGGAEERIRATQFCFRPKKSTAQALAIMRRIFDAAYSAGKPGMMALFLDWAKAFDRIKIDCLMAALQRFGVPQPLLQLIGAIYDKRMFILRDSSGNSTKRLQRAGIAQGCPLSPYLFILVQTVLLSDVDRIMASRGQVRLWPEEPPYLVCSDILYADDTVLLSSVAGKLQMHLDILVE